MKYTKSPINYSGSKYRLLNKGLMDYFPKDIDIFVDLFGGAGNVAINSNADIIIYNEYIDYLPKLFDLWKYKSLTDINNYIDNTISQFQLSPTNEQSFIEFRKHYNETKNIEDLFILICYSFNYQMRFNNKQEYNSSFGKKASTMNDNIRKNLNIFAQALKEKDIQIYNKDFRELNINFLTDKSFVYLDPPYSLSCGVYQDGKRGFKGWSKEDDIALFDLIDKLNGNNIRFALSNLIESKGMVNELLIDRCKNYNTHYLNISYNGANYQRQNSNKDIEVLITNY